MNDGEPSPVHQLLLGLKDNEGVAIVKHSMTSESEALSWQRRLEEHARLLPWGAESTLPGKALSYYRFDGNAVVLRRWATGGNLGRSDAHALIGPINVLTVPVALGLDRGLDWQGAALFAQKFLVDRELVSLAETIFATLRDSAAREPEMLRRALGRLIDAQAKPLTILGCPDDHRVALTWALVHIGSEYLAKASHLRRDWNFSTYEVDDADSISNLPEIIFMPGIPEGRGVASRDIVDVSRDQRISPHAEKWSNLLVQRFISGVPLVPEFDYSSAMSVAKEKSISTGQSEQREQEPQPEQSVPDRRQGQTGAGAYPTRWEEKTENSQPTRTSATQITGSQGLKRILDKLFHAEDKDLFKCQLNALGKSSEERAKIRELLSVDDFLELVFLIMKWNPSVREMHELFQSLRVATFGSEGCDLSDPDVAEFAVQLVAHESAPVFFVRALVQEIDKNGQSNRVDPVLAVRWRRNQAENLASASHGGHRLRRTVKAGPLGAVMSALATPQALFAATGIVLVVFVLFFAVYSLDPGTPMAGSNATENQSSTTTAPAAQGIPPVDGSAKPSVLVSGGVKSHDLVIRPPWPVPGENMVAFLLLRVVGESQFYPQGKCAVDPQKNTTLICNKLGQLTGSLENKTAYEALVIKIRSGDEQRYQDVVAHNRSLRQDQLPEPRETFMISGLP